MEEISIRIAKPEDRDAIELLTRLLVSERSEKFDQKRFEWGLLRRLYDPLQRHGIFVAELKTSDNVVKLVGMIFSELRVDPFGYSEAYIKQFYVRPKYRRQGIGRALLETAIAHLKKMNVQLIKINVSPDAEEAFKMQSRLNFKTKYHVLELKLRDDDSSPSSENKEKPHLNKQETDKSNVEEKD